VSASSAGVIGRDLNDPGISIQRRDRRHSSLNYGLLAQLHTETPLLKQDLGSGCGGLLRAILLYAVNYRLRDPLSKRETRCNVAAEMYS
jgi:hypothetical protein